MKKSPFYIPSTLPLQNYEFDKMAPSSATANRSSINYYDNQYTSLFGDPVPPPQQQNEFIENLDSQLYSRLRRGSTFNSTMEMEDEDFPKPDIYVEIKDERPKTTFRSRSGTSKSIFSAKPIEDQYQHNLPTVSGNKRLLSPQNLGPDIKILPDSGTDSSENIQSPNFYSPNKRLSDIGSLDTTYTIETQPHFLDIVKDEEPKRLSDDYQKNRLYDLISEPQRIFSKEPTKFIRQFSNESYSSGDWFKPSHDYQEFTKIPKLRPSSKNVMSINKQEINKRDSPVATLIHDSNGSSSDMEKLPEEKLYTELNIMEPPLGRPKTPMRYAETPLTNYLNEISNKRIQNQPFVNQPVAMPRKFSKQDSAESENNFQNNSTIASPIKREPSPAIMTNTICTGADHRLKAPKPHKNKSFTIIAEKSPAQSSSPQSPQHQQKDGQSGRLSPFLGHGFKEPPKPPPRQKQRSLTSTSLKLPSITNNSDDSPRPSVQFDMSSNKRMTQKKQPKGILQHKQPGMPFSNMPPTQMQNHKKNHSFENLPQISGIPGPKKSHSKRLIKLSSDSTHNNRTASAKDIRSLYNPNPTSREKGLMRIISSADNSPSRALLKSNWIPRSLSNLTQNDMSRNQLFKNDQIIRRHSSLSPPGRGRRKSSTSTDRRSSSQTDHRNSLSSDRRSSNLSSVTTSDFSSRRNSISPNRRKSISPNVGLRDRRKSIFQPNMLQKKVKSNFRMEPNYLKVKDKTQRKVAKPTTLSPIIGTPNKDDPLSAEEIASSARFVSNINRSDSLTRIPVRNGSNLTSRVESRTNSRGPSAVSSRSSSPRKDYTPMSRPNSRLDSRSPSRATNHSRISRPVSRTDSRPTSRLESKPTSRTSSRAGRYENVSRSNSRQSISPPKSRISRRKSISSSRSTSPQKFNRKSTSPHNPKAKSQSRSRSRSRGRTKSKTRKSPEKKTKIPSRNTSPKKGVSAKSSSGSPKKSSFRTTTTTSAKKTPSRTTYSKTSPSKSPTRKKTSTVQKELSNLSRSGSNLKKEGLKRETSSLKKNEGLVNREPSNLKREQSNLVKNSGLKKETSSVKSGQLKKEPSSTKIEGLGKLKREPSLMKKRTDSNLSKKLEKKESGKSNNQKNDEMNQAIKDTSNNTATDKKEIKENNTTTDASESNDKLIPLTKANVVSMTTAAITAQPVQITTAVTNQVPLNKINSAGELVDVKPEDMALPASIIEKSQKTLENIQKTVTEATDEIHKTIKENLTDLKALETDMSKKGDGIGTPIEKSDGVKNVVDNPTTTVENQKLSQPVEASVSVLKTSDRLHPKASGKNDGVSAGGTNGQKLGEDMAERVSERSISVLPDVECDSGNLQKSDHRETDVVDPDIKKDATTMKPIASNEATDIQHSIEGQIKQEGITNQGVNQEGNANVPQISGGISQENLNDDLEQTGCCGRSKCCKCCSRFCMPCRRSKCCRKKQQEVEQAIIQEVDETIKKESCWNRMKCSRCCKSKTKGSAKTSAGRMETIAEEYENNSMAGSKQSKCSMCLNKFLCCRATNKVESTNYGQDDTKKCCFCLPCRRKRQTESTIEPAWQAPEATTAERRESILSAPTLPPESRCTRIINKLKFWKKKDPSRRASQSSRKQSLAPTNPPEDTRPKLHNDLVEYNSKMKGAIPVLPICLAYFCIACNIICPGLGTILSGIFCLCVGIPRFSQYDSAKARFGSFFINCIVGIAQFFCVLFCFVGWGWSIWWGSIMLKTARKLQKIRKVERLELEEEQRQAQLAAEAAAAAKAAEKDVEAGKG